MPPPRCPGSQAGHGEAETVLPLADPTGVIQQALGGFPVGCNYGQQVIPAWLMTLPEDINRAQAARSLLAAQLPSCCTTMASVAPEVREMLRFVTSCHARRSC
jgi:hypothetical protein